MRSRWHDPLGMDANDLAPTPWRSRGYLPHFDAPGLVQAITWRLADAVPRDVIEAWRRQRPRRRHDAAIELRRRIARYEDAGKGSCVLRHAVAARLVEDALLQFDGVRYRLLAWCVMPNHVHALIETKRGFPLAKVVHGWKSYTATAINRALGLRGRLWMPEYFDRFIRDMEHLERVIAYIHANPVSACLVRRPEDWPWSSARRA